MRSADRPVPARVRVPRDAAARDDRRPRREGTLARLRRQLHAARRGRDGAEPDERRLPAEGAEEAPSPRSSRGCASTRPYGKEVKRFLAHGIGIHHAGLLAQVPPPRREARAEGAARDRQRDRHAGRRREHPASAPCSSRSSASSTARRPPSSACATSSRSPGAPGGKGFDERGLRRRAGARARHREPAARGEGGGRSGEARSASCARSRPSKGYVHWDRATFERLVDARSPSRSCRASASRTGCSSRCSSAPRRRLPRDGAHHPPLARAARRSGASSGARRARCSSRWSRRASSRSSRGRGGCACTSTCRRTSRSTTRSSLWLVDTLDAARPREPDVRARRAHAGRVDPREPGLRPAPAARRAQDARRWPS